MGELVEWLDFESQVSHALFVRLNEISAVLLALLHDALVARLLRFRTSATRLQRFRLLLLFLGFDFFHRFRHLVAGAFSTWQCD